MSVARRCFAAWRGLVAKRAALEHLALHFAAKCVAAHLMRHT